MYCCYLKLNTMKKHWKIKPFWTSLFVLLVIYSCNKPDFNKIAGGTLNTDLAAPIGYSTFGVYDVLASNDSNDLVVINPIDGELALKYNGEIGSFDAKSVLSFPNHNETFHLNNSNLGLSNSIGFNGSVASSNAEYVTFPMSSGIILNTVNVKSGTMAINVNTTLKHNITVNLTFLDTKINNQPIQKVINLNYNGSTPVSNNTIIDLTGTICDFTANGTGTNRLRLIVDATVNGTGQSIIGNENFDIDVNFTDLDFTNATGYFGQQSVNALKDTIELKIFNNASTGVFGLTNPKLNFKIDNSFGIPIELNINNLKTINPVSNVTVNLNNSNLNNITINPSPGFGQKSTTTITELDKNNTPGMNSIVSSTPKNLFYDVDIQTNPNGNTGPLNFIESTSKLTVFADLDLPLEGYAYGFQMKDTLPFGMSNSPEEIQSVLIRINSTNGFPISFSANVSFLDSNDVKLFDVFTSPETVLKAAPVNSSGRVTKSVNKITDIEIPKSKINQLDNVKKIVVIGTAATTEPQLTNVKIYDNYKLTLKLGVKVVLKKDF